MSTSSSSDDWLQSLVSSPSKHDTRVLMTPPNKTTTTTTESSGSGSHPSPKGSRSKPLRRRSRASRRTPSTLLNATTANFRALVQQFTGCPMSLHARKGPVTLNFGGQHNQYHTAGSNYNPNPSSSSSSSAMAPLTNTYHQRYDSQPPVTTVVLQPQPLQYGHQQYFTHHDEQQQRCMYSSPSSSSFNNVDIDRVFLGGDMESNAVGDGLSMNNLSSLHEILGRDSDFFMSEDLM